MGNAPSQHINHIDSLIYNLGKLVSCFVVLQTVAVAFADIQSYITIKTAEQFDRILPQFPDRRFQYTMSQQPEPDAFTAPFQLTKTTHRNPYPAISPENPKNNQGGTIIVISGGGRGIGLVGPSLCPPSDGHALTSSQTVAKVWARAGASGIVLAGRSIDTLAKAEKEIQSINNEVKLLLVPTDISGEKDVENLFSEVQKSFGRAADVLVNNAGFLEEQKLVGEADVNEWWKGMVGSAGILRKAATNLRWSRLLTSRGLF